MKKTGIFFLGVSVGFPFCAVLSPVLVRRFCSDGFSCLLFLPREPNQKLRIRDTLRSDCTRVLSEASSVSAGFLLLPEDGWKFQYRRSELYIVWCASCEYQVTRYQEHSHLEELHEARDIACLNVAQGASPLTVSCRGIGNATLDIEPIVLHVFYLAVKETWHRRKTATLKPQACFSNPS